MLLAASPAFDAAFRTRPIAAVHTVTEQTVEELRRAVADAALIVMHPVRDGYHGFPVGSEEILACAAADCRRITIPALYYDGLYPFHVYVRGADGRTRSAPLSIYHDLRFLYCAWRGLGLRDAQAWCGEFEPPPEGLRQVAAGARERLRAYEAELDVCVTEDLTGPELHGASFLTVDHPTNLGLDRVAAGVHAELAIPYRRTLPAQELIGEFQAPLERAVIDALDLGVTPRPDWLLRGATVTQDELLAKHLAWYDEHRELVAAGVEQNGDRMLQLGLGAI